MIRSVINRISFPQGIPYYDYEQEYPGIVSPHTVEAGCKTQTIYSAFIKNENAEKLVIYAHGNAETIHFLVPMLQHYSCLYNCCFVTYDYEGCGMSSGASSYEALIRAAECVYKKYKDQPYDFIAWGRSIGSVGATYLGATYRLPTIIQSGLASAYDVVFEKVHLNCGNQFMNYKSISRIYQLTIIHGEQDDVVPIRNAAKLFATWIKHHARFDTTKTEHIVPGMHRLRHGSCTFYVILGAGHNDIESCYRDQFHFAVEAALRESSGAKKLE